MFALFVVQIARSLSLQEEQKLQNFEGVLKENLSSAEGIKIINPHTYLCSLSEAAGPLVTLTECAKKWEIKFQIAFFKEELQWVSK